MVCSLVKKGLLGAALGAGTLFLVFGTSAPSYVKTAFYKMRQTAKDSIDPRFEIERARTGDRQPAAGVRSEQGDAGPGRGGRRAAPEGDRRGPGQPGSPEGHDRGTMRDKVKNGDYRLTGHVVGTAEEVKARLAQPAGPVQGAPRAS